VEKFNNSKPMTYANEFVLTYHQVLENERLPFSSVYFGDTSDCVPKKLRKKDKCFQLPEKIKKFLLQANGKNASEFCEKIEELKEQLLKIRSAAASDKSLIQNPAYEDRELLLLSSKISLETEPVVESPLCQQGSTEFIGLRKMTDEAELSLMKKPSSVRSQDSGIISDTFAEE